MDKDSEIILEYYYRKYFRKEFKAVLKELIKEETEKLGKAFDRKKGKYK